MKKGLRILIPAVIIFLTGTVLIPIIFILKVLAANPADGSFTVPGSTVISVSEPGRYYLWNNFRTVFEGKSYSQSPAVPGGLTFVIEDQSGNVLPFRGDQSTSVNLGSNAKNSIGFVDVQAAGKLTISVSGDIDERVFSFSPFNLKPFFAVLLVAIVCAIIGLGLGIWGIITLANSGSAKRVPKAEASAP